MSEQFTHGPWMRDGISVTVERPAGETRKAIAIVSPDTSISAGKSYARMVANARLIAAAPDLLAALERVIEAAERALGDHIAPHDCFATGPMTGNPIADLIACPGCVQQNEIADARAALAKARGES